MTPFRFLRIEVAVGLAIAVVALYAIDVLEERTAALVLAATVLVGAVVFVVRRLRDGFTDDRGRVVALGLGALLFVAVAVPVVATLLPGTPVAHGAMAHEGDRLHLPDDVAGRIRVLVHGEPAGHDVGTLDFRLAGAEQPLEGRLERRARSARLGRGPRRTVLEAHDDEYLGGVLGGAHELRLESLHGEPAGPLEISVFREWWPLRNTIVAGLLLLGAIALACWRRGIDTAAAAMALAALAFGALDYAWANPATAVRPEIGAILAAAVAGFLVHVGILRLARSR
jgi:hypothetical protein